MIGITSVNLTAQTTYPVGIFAKITDTQTKTSLAFHTYLDELKSKPEVISAQPAFPGAQSVALQETMFIKLQGSANYAVFGENLKASGHFEEVTIEYVPALTCDPSSQSCPDPSTTLEPSECSSPVNFNDPGTQCTRHIERMELPCAWTESNGSSDVVVGVVDVYFDNSHPDLTGKFLSISGDCREESATSSHGYATSGGVAAIRNNGMHVAGAGGETKLRGYCVGGGDCGLLPTTSLNTLAWEAYLDGVDVINISYSSNSWNREMIAEIVEGGTTVVVAARGDSHQEIADIDGVINVGQLTESGNYQRYDGGTPDENLDIAVPILNLHRLTSPLVDFSGYGSGNTSMAAPYVAGTIALMRAEAPCIPPAIIEKILKETSNNIPNADEPSDQYYAELNGAGALNAYQAVLAAKSFQSETLLVGPNETVIIENDVRSFKKVEVDPLGKLVIINSQIFMDEPDPSSHKTGFFTVKRGAKLIFKRSTVTAACRNGMWGGIRVWGNNDREQPDVWATVGEDEVLDYNVPVTTDDAGMVLFDIGTKITRAKRVVGTRSDAVPYAIQVDRRGGLVAGKGATFIDNGRVGEFLQYPRPSGGYAFANKSRFVLCNFKETSEETEKGIGFTIWDTDGITFDHCTFREFDHESIVAFDAKINITSGNVFFKSEEYTTGNRSRIISAVSTYPFSGGLNIGGVNNDPNIFNYAARRGAMIHSYGQNSFDATIVTECEFNSKYVGEGSISATGIYLEGPADYNISSNSFNSTANRIVGTITGRAFDTGVALNNTGVNELFSFSRISCNDMDDFYTGVRTSSNNSFVEILSNDFQEANRAIRISGTVNEKQGSEGRPAGNCFDSTVDTRISTTGTVSPFRYYIDETLTMPCEMPETSTVFEIKETPNNENNCNQNRPPLPNPGSKEGIKQARSNAFANLSANPTNEQYQDEYQEANEAYGHFFRGMIKSKLLEGEVNQAINYALEINAKEFPYELFGTYMQLGRYNDAEALLNATSLTDKKTLDFKAIQEINLEYLRDTNTYVLSPKNFELLDAISLEGTANSGYAKGLMLLTADRRYSVPELEEDVPKIASVVTEETEQVLVYPNPSNNTLFVELPNSLLEEGKEATIQIISVVGRVVHEEKLYNFYSRHSIGLNNIEAGTYFLRILPQGKPQCVKKITIIK
ncbi:S8 family serine peptidase [Neolewinella agarilytica]|uniref:Por secretion system C-terminal sorting domain-containing protein n=1 Tax=Neolewinella agarilytica TaxID=478744 RepID=A0A1H9G7X6_9BACT|nr:S8 family serine peptidase [Neolewinella agarilytica]SEQ46169.1 Por secretion system C-terminal sorting domain-containing protein [Neolewinella agarilytica]